MGFLGNRGSTQPGIRARSCVWTALLTLSLRKELHYCSFEPLAKSLFTESPSTVSPSAVTPSSSHLPPSAPHGSSLPWPVLTALFCPPFF